MAARKATTTTRTTKGKTAVTSTSLAKVSRRPKPTTGKNAGDKRPATANIGTDRANKRSKTAPDAATIRAIEERITELDASQVDSDDEFVGAFDDDESFEPDEQEDEIDQDIVTPRWSGAPTPMAQPRSTARQLADANEETPVWNQPEPGPTGPDNTEADIGDDDDEPELTIHEQEHHELRWPQETRLIHPIKGRWSLRVQSRSVKAVVQDAFPLAQHYVASVNAFPSLREKVKMGRDVLYRAATEGEFNTITDRLSRDRWYGQWLSPLVDARISIFRGEVRSVAGATIASYGITDPDQADDFLLPGLTYIYPVDPITKKLQEDKPYRHPAIEATIRAAFFDRRDGEDFLGLCESSLPGSEKPEVPIPMVALSATAIHAALDDYGEPRGSFSAELYKDVYLRHTATLKNIKESNPQAFHIIMASLYTRCMRVGGRRPVEPLPINVAALCTTFED